MSGLSRKQREYLRRQGISSRTPAAPVIAHVQMLHASGMSVDRIAFLSRVTAGTAHKYLRGGYVRGGERHAFKNVSVDIARRVLAVQPEGPPVTDDRQAGAQLDPTGTRRRVQALGAAGFPLSYISAELVGTFSTHASQMMGYRKVSSVTARQVDEAYRKHRADDPLDHGIAPATITRAKARAARDRWAPWTCWDDDTIDDPDAIPEWTGACGTREGLQIHTREGIPVCGPCLAARKRRNIRTASRGEFDPVRFEAFREAAGYSKRRLEQEAGLTKGGLSHWASGRNQPLPHAIDKVMSILGVPVSEVYQEQENV